MTTIRKVDTSNPATPSGSFPLVPLLKPASGNLTLTATVYRDSGDDTPTLVTVKDQTGATLGSTILTTPAGNLTANILIPATALATCQAKPTIECTPEPPVLTNCSSIPIPKTLQAAASITGTTISESFSYALVYSDLYALWIVDPAGGVRNCGCVFMGCYGTTLADLVVAIGGSCPYASSFSTVSTINGMNPFSATLISDGYYDGEPIHIEVNVTE